MINGLTATSNVLSSLELTDLIADALEFMYIPWPDNSDRYALRTQLIDLLSDYIYFAPSHEVADIHSQTAPVYMYEFAHRRVKYNQNPTWMGVVHGDNVPYDFGLPLLPKFGFAFDDADRNVSGFIMAMYANFARSGDPTVSGIPWDKYNSSQRAYLRVDINHRMEASFNSRRMSFWNNYYPKLKQLKFDTTGAVKNDASPLVAMGTFSQIVFVLLSAML